MLVIVGALLIVLAPAFKAASRLAKGVHCINNLKNIGLAFRVFATDHDSQWPWQVPASEGGSAETEQKPELLWRHFLVLTNGYMRANNLDSPKYLWCPLDSAKRAAATFYSNSASSGAVVFSGNQQVSYFLNLGANTNELQAEIPDRILSGDRNLLVDGKSVDAGATYLSGGQSVGFTPGRIHRRYGHFLFADGSVQEVWTNWIVRAHSATNLLLFP